MGRLIRRLIMKVLSTLIAIASAGQLMKDNDGTIMNWHGPHGGHHGFFEGFPIIMAAMADPGTTRVRPFMVTVHTVVIHKTKKSTMLKLWRNSRNKNWPEWLLRSIMMMMQFLTMVVDTVMDTVMDTTMDMDAITVAAEDTNLFQIRLFKYII